MNNSFYPKSNGGSVESGATLLEYVLITLLIMFVCVLGVTTVGRPASEMFSQAASGFGGG